LVRRRDAGKARHLSRPHPGVQTFRIAAFTLRNVALHVDLEERAGGKACPHGSACRARRGDERAQDEVAMLEGDASRLTCAADVLGAVPVAESEVTAQPVAELVAIEQERLTAALEQPTLEQACDRRLAGARQTGEPE